MADINKSFSLKILADITAYQQELLKLPGVTEKQAAAAALRLEREMVKAAAAAGKAAQAAADGGVKGLEKGLGQVKEQAALVAAGVSKISPELGAVVNMGQAVVGVFKAATAAIGPIGLAMAAVGVAVAAAGSKFTKWNESLNDAAQLSADVTNEILKQQLGLVDRADAAARAIELNERSAQARRLTATQRYFETVNDLADKNVVISTIASGTIARFWRDEERISKELAATLALQAKGYAAIAIEERDAAQASKDYAKQLEKERESFAAMGEAEAERIAKQKKAQADAKRAAEQAAKDAAASVEAQRKETQERFDIVDEARKKKAKADEKAAADEQAAALETYRVKKGFIEQQTKLEEEAAATRKAAQMEAFDATQALALAGVAAATAMFGDMKELAIAEAVINTAAAVVTALKNPPGPPFSTAQAVAAGAMGAAQIAKIASTNVAHSGLAFDPSAGSRQATAPDETTWKLRKNEGVLTARGVQAAGGYQQVRRMNAGQSPSMGSSFVGITQFKHKMLDATIGPNIARPAAARTEIKAIAQSGGRVGHRLRSNT